MSAPAEAPERWALDAGDGPSATLTIPPDARRERRFELAVALTVAVPEAVAPGAWLQLTVMVNGARQWQRRVPAHNPGQWDGLDYRMALRVPVRQALRITAASEVQGVRRRGLLIEADEAG